MQQSILAMSRLLIDSISYNDLDKKKELQKCFKATANEIVEESIIFCNSYADINNSLRIDLELGALNESIGRYVSELREIQKEYIFLADDNSHLSKVNKKEILIIEQIRKRINIISNEISKLLSK